MKFAPNLESLLFSEDERPLDLEAVDCINLKKLHAYIEFIDMALPLPINISRTLFLNFPFLKTCSSMLSPSD